MEIFSGREQESIYESIFLVEDESMESSEECPPFQACDDRRKG